MQKSVKTPMPAGYPMQGYYTCNHFHVKLACADETARIYYTLDGSDPDAHSTPYLPDQGGVQLLSFFTEFAGSEQAFRIRAIAYTDGKAPSEIAELTYHLRQDARGAFRYEVLRDGTEDTPGLIRIMDYSDVNLYLIIGSERAMLVDGGMDDDPGLYDLIDSLTGGLPLAMFVTHGHPDHNAQVWNFAARGVPVYYPAGDVALQGQFGSPALPEGLLPIRDGDTYDLGNTVLTAYDLPGHTPDGKVLLDEKTQDLYTSDQLGNNNPIGPNTTLLNLAGPECALDRYRRALLALRGKIDGRADRVLTGHNYHSISYERFIASNLAAVERVIEGGEDALVPCIRPAGECMGSGTMAEHGDYRIDQEYAGINVNFIYEKDAMTDPPHYVRGSGKETA